MSCIEPEQTKAKTAEKSPYDFSVEQVLDWLSSLEFPETDLNAYKEAFKSNGVDGGMLEELTDDLLKTEIGVSKPLHRIKIFKAI